MIDNININKNQRYNNFESFREIDDIHIKFNDDGHFNSKGCEVISNSIVKKLTEYE